MAEREDLIDSIEKEIKGYKDALKGIKDLDESVPSIQERIKEAEVKLLVAKNAPVDYMTENAPTLLTMQLYDESRVTLQVENFRGIVSPMVSEFSSSSGTTSTYDNLIVNLVSNGQPYSAPPFPFPTWIEPINYAITELAKYKAQKADLPPKLEKIKEDLGKKFTVALATIEKAKNRIVGVDQAAIHMRDVLDQAWSGVANIVKEKNPKRPHKYSELHLRKQANRTFVAECLGKDEAQNRKLVLLFENMKILHSTLSATDFGKNPLSDDRAKMERLFRSWILLLDDLN